MKKLLIASTALSLAGGAALAEMAITTTGDAKMGVNYDSESDGGVSKHSFVHEIGIDFGASGTTDGGLTFGASAGFDVSDKAINTGTVHVSGSFGTLTIGGNDAADLTAGSIADIGLNDIGVNDGVHDLRGTTASQLRYDNNFGQISIAISAGTATIPAVLVKEATPGSPEVTAAPGVYRYKFPGEEVADKDGEVPDLGFGELFQATTSDAGVIRKEGPRVVHEDEQDAYEDAVVEYILESTEATDTLVVDAVAITYDENGDGTGGDLDLTTIRRGGSGKDPDATATTPAEDESKFYTIAGGSVDAVAPGVTEAQMAAWDMLAERYGVDEDGGLDADGGDIINQATPEAKTIVAHTAAKEAVDAMGAVFDPAKSETQYAFGMKFNAGGVTIGVGYDSKKTVSMGVGFSAGEVSTNLLYVKTDEEHADGEMTGMGADMKYTMGASAVTLAYGRTKPKEGEATDAVGMGVTHSLGGGATMNAGFGKVGESNKASIGLSFKF